MHRDRLVEPGAAVARVMQADHALILDPDHRRAGIAPQRVAGVDQLALSRQRRRARRTAFAADVLGLALWMANDPEEFRIRRIIVGQFQNPVFGRGIAKDLQDRIIKLAAGFDNRGRDVLAIHACFAARIDIAQNKLRGRNAADGPGDIAVHARYTVVIGKDMLAINDKRRAEPSFAFFVQ